MLKTFWQFLLALIDAIKLVLATNQARLSIKGKKDVATTKHIDDFSFGYNPQTGLYTWPKGKDYKLSDNLTTYEFECKCDNTSCHVQKISKTLVTRLQQLRDQSEGPLRINSGYRCATYQLKLARQGLKTAKKTSQHELGAAADVMPARAGGNFGKRFNKFVLITEGIFKAIGYGNGWLHVDVRDDVTRHWTYQ